ncbi:hypothetical protein [Pleomorphomonas koreensis]|uniref:hypothetical protein n=1 Tax=Pleomorphomonas koreensis TaxID=257440 RepID=UPI00047D6658|nr:hypothetical protein [Pleomorphomonas koreensis]
MADFMNVAGAIAVMPDRWARTLMEVVASEGDDAERCLHHLQGVTVALAAMCGVESDVLASGLAAHIEHFNKAFSCSEKGK